jgi:hypothetical protein
MAGGSNGLQPTTARAGKKISRNDLSFFGHNQWMQQRPEIAVEVQRSWARPIVLVPIFALIALVGGALPSFSAAANLLVLGVGGALFWLGLSHHVRRRAIPARLAARATWWLLPLAVLVGTEAANYLLGSTPAHPTISKLADPVLEGYPARSAMYFGWLCAFWGLVRR